MNDKSPSKLQCGAYARIGTNDTEGPREHSPGCVPHAKPVTARPEPITLGEANAIEGYAREIADACGQIDRASQSPFRDSPATRRTMNHAAMDRDVAFGRLVAVVLATLQRVNGSGRFKSGIEGGG